jgi:hypothetical protein
MVERAQACPRRATLSQGGVASLRDAKRPSILSAMWNAAVIGRRIIFLSAGTVLVTHAQSARVTLDDPDIKLLYPLAQQVQVMAEVCQRDLPAQSAGVPAALALWNDRHGRVQLDSLINAIARRRAAMGRTMMRMSGTALLGADPAAACGNFGSFVSTAQFDLGVANPTALRDARRKLGVPERTTVAASPTVTTISPTASGASGSVSPPDVAAGVPTPPIATPVHDANLEPPPVDIVAAGSSASTATPARRGTSTTRPARSRSPSSTTGTTASQPPAQPASPAPSTAAAAIGEPPEVEISSGPPTTRGAERGSASQPSRSPSTTTSGAESRMPTPPVAEERRVATLAEVAGPPGWQRQLLSDGSISFRNPPTDSGPVTLFIYPDQPRGNQPIDTALKRWLVAKLSPQLDMADEFKYGGVHTAFTTRGQLAAYADIDPDFPNSRDGMSVLSVAIARGNGVFTPMILISRDDHFQYDHKKTFATWFATATLPGDAGVRWSLRSSARPGPLRGLWMGTSLTNQLNLYGGLDLIANRHYATFFQNGIVYSELPDGGQIDNLDLAQVCSKNPTDCGTYRLEGNRLISQFPNSVGLINTDTSELEDPRDLKSGMTFDGQSLFKVAPVAAMRLNGEYTSIDGSSSGPNGSLTLVRSIAFAPDGRYESTGSVGFLSTPGGLSSDNGTVAGYIPGSEKRGTYTIEGYTLTLKPDVGPVRFATIVFFDDERPVKSVLIDDQYYKR